MADSTVTFTSIDEEYPIAGQDNDSQGFRDNFSEIKQALQATNIELTDLLTNGARLDNENNFNSNTISNADFIAVTEKVYNTGIFNQDSTIEWSDGLYQNVTIADDITLTLDNWADNGRLSKMRLALRSDGTPRTVVWVAANAGNLRVSANWPTTFTVESATDAVFVDVWTSDSGSNVFMEYIGKFEILS